MGDVGRTAQAAASVADAGIGYAATVHAADAAANATKYAVDQTSKTAANSLAFNKNVYDTTQKNEQPYMAAGSTAAGQLNTGLQDGSLTAGYGPKFSFTGVDLLNDPAYQFDLQQGQDAIQRSAAASGGLVSGGALKDLDAYSQGYASNQYQQSYENALGQYQQAYNQFETQQSNKYNRLASVAGLGQNAVTGTATSGNAAAGTNAAVSTNAANSIANLTTANASAQGAAGMAGAGAIQSGVNSIANAFQSQSNSSYGSGSGNGGQYDSNGNYLGE